MAYTGGTNVKNGFYWSMQAWDMAMVPAEGGLLPGGADRTYTRIPTLMFLLLAPAMGALYVVFLPFVGFAMVLGYAARWAKRATTDAFMSAAVAIAPTWAPGEAYLAARKREKASKTATSGRETHDSHK